MRANDTSGESSMCHSPHIHWLPSAGNALRPHPGHMSTKGISTAGPLLRLGDAAGKRACASCAESTGTPTCTVLLLIQLPILLTELASDLLPTSASSASLPSSPPPLSDTAGAAAAWHMEERHDVSRWVWRCEQMVVVVVCVCVCVCVW